MPRSIPRHLLSSSSSARSCLREGLTMRSIARMSSSARLRTHSRRFSSRSRAASTPNGSTRARNEDLDGTRPFVTCVCNVVSLHCRADGYETPVFQVAAEPPDALHAHAEAARKVACAQVRILLECSTNSLVERLRKVRIIIVRSRPPTSTAGDQGSPSQYSAGLGWSA